MIVVAHQHPTLRFSRKETFAAIRAVLRNRGTQKRSISVVFVNNRFMRRINRRFLKHDESTDVIAFPLEDGIGMDGELYINLDRAKNQASGAGIPFREEVLRLLIHGTLHLLGYRDTTKPLKQKMTRKEDYFLARLGR